MAGDPTVGQGLAGGNDTELVGTGEPVGGPAVKMVTRIEIPHLGTDPGRKGGNIEQVHRPDGAAAIKQGIPVGGNILAGGAENAEAGYGDPFTYH